MPLLYHSRHKVTISYLMTPRVSAPRVSALAREKPRRATICPGLPLRGQKNTGGHQITPDPTLASALAHARLLSARMRGDKNGGARSLSARMRGDK